MAGILVGCALAVVLHQQVFNSWWVEDAAISFAYARNLAAGEGLVPWPGGERIEGYSNPSWVLLLALAQGFGVEGFTASKVLGTLFAVLALWPTWRLARRAVHPDDRPADLLAPILLAGSAQFAIWSASGLENGLFGFLLVSGAARLVDEVEAPLAPWSSVWFLALAWTRPEGVVYAGVAACWFAYAVVRDGRGLRALLAWCAVFLAIELVFVGARFWYFAWPLPNTYYAKIDSQLESFWAWSERGWMQIRGFSSVEGTLSTQPGGPGLGQGFFLPVYLAGLFGARGWRGAVLGATTLAVFALLAFPGPDWLRNSGFWFAFTPFEGWQPFRVVVLLALLVASPFAALGATGLGLVSRGETRWLTRGFVFHLMGIGVFFAVYSGGDWMRGYRWMSLFAPTGAVVLATGAGELASAAERLASRLQLPGSARNFRVVGVALLGLFLATQLALNAVHTAWFARDPEWSPQLIKRRVVYTQGLADLLFYDEPLVPLDMDMGAHLWYSRQHPVDMAGLVDIPMSRHAYRDRHFIEEYVFGEHPPDFAHVHGGWLRRSAVMSYPEWSDYFETPGYPDPREPGGVHEGVWMRRSLFMEPPEGRTEAGAVPMARGVTLWGPSAPSPVTASGGDLYVELALSLDDPTDRMQLVVFLAGPGGVKSHFLPPGYGLLSPGRWRRGEIFQGRWAIPVGELTPGLYSLGVVVLDRRGEVIAPLAAARSSAPPAFARGEYVSSEPVRIVAQGGAEVFAFDALRDALSLAASGACSDAEASWTRARRHLPRDRAWHSTHEPATVLADCWARSAEGLRTDDAVEALARAHRWDHGSAELLRVGKAIGERLWLSGRTARARGDWDTAYRSFDALLRFQPWRSWARRYAEEARDHRLAIVR